MRFTPTIFFKLLSEKHFLFRTNKAYRTAKGYNPTMATTTTTFVSDETLLQIWNENGKPTDHKEIYMLLVNHSKLIGWKSFSPRLLYQAADWLLSMVEPEETAERYEEAYESLIDEDYEDDEEEEEDDEEEED